MKLGRLTVAQNLEVWEPRYHDKGVLVAAWKVGNHNILTFPKAKSMTSEYYISGEKCRAFPVEKKLSKAGKWNDFYVVPKDALELFEGRE